MSLPDGWVTACELAEDRLKDHIPIEAINPTLCVETSCPAAKVLQIPISGGMMIQIYCTFSKCIHRLPEKKDLRFMK